MNKKAYLLVITLIITSFNLKLSAQEVQEIATATSAVAQKWIHRLKKNMGFWRNVFDNVRTRLCA